MLWFYERFNFNESYFTIHPFFARKIADAIIFYAREVLKIFNRHLNHKHEFTIIIIIIIITSTSDLQPSTPTVNQLPGQLVSTEIRTMYKYKF